MKTMWKLVFLILCTNYFTLGVHIRRRSSDYDNQEKPKVGTQCDSDERCTSLENSSCVETKCTCKEGFVSSTEKDACLKKAAQVNGECQIQEQCGSIADSTCKNNKCVLPKEIGESCAENSDCKTANNLECKEGTCVCLESHVETEKSCVKKAENLGDNCTVEGQCTPISAQCVENVCQAITTIPTPPVPNENYCSESVNCTNENTTCVENTCRCKDGFVGSDNTKTCIKEAEKLGDECTEDAQCSKLENATCHNKVCAVQPTQRLVQSAAADSAPKLGGSCVKDECQNIQNSICKESVCQCTEEYITSLDENKCLKKAKSEGDSCEIDKQCEGLGEATCSGSKCVKAALGKSLDNSDKDRENSATTLKWTGAVTSLLIIGTLQLI